MHCSSMGGRRERYIASTLQKVVLHIQKEVHLHPLGFARSWRLWLDCASMGAHQEQQVAAILLRVEDQDSQREVGRHTPKVGRHTPKVERHTLKEVVHHSPKEVAVLHLRPVHRTLLRDLR